MFEKLKKMFGKDEKCENSNTVLGYQAPTMSQSERNAIGRLIREKLANEAKEELKLICSESLFETIVENTKEHDEYWYKQIKKLVLARVSDMNIKLIVRGSPSTIYDDEKLNAIILILFKNENILLNTLGKTALKEEKKRFVIDENDVIERINVY